LQDEISKKQLKIEKRRVQELQDAIAKKTGTQPAAKVVTGSQRKKSPASKGDSGAAGGLAGLPTPIEAPTVNYSKINYKAAALPSFVPSYTPINRVPARSVPKATGKQLAAAAGSPAAPPNEYVTWDTQPVHRAMVEIQAVAAFEGGAKNSAQLGSSVAEKVGKAEKAEKAEKAVAKKAAAEASKKAAAENKAMAAAKAAKAEAEAKAKEDAKPPAQKFEEGAVHALSQYIIGKGDKAPEVRPVPTTNTARPRL
jgi:hypothetical protein